MQRHLGWHRRRHEGRREDHHRDPSDSQERQWLQQQQQRSVASFHVEVERARCCLVHVGMGQGGLDAANGGQLLPFASTAVELPMMVAVH